MRKMKKLFSKIITLVLLVAMLIPYTNIPKVEAEETCNGEWEYHTNYYFFLQAEHPDAWTSYLTENNGEFQTNYYTSFLYNFPSDGSTIDFDCDECSSGFVKITDDDDYDEDFNAGNNTKEWSVAQFYYEYKKEGKASTFAGDYAAFAYTTKNSSGTKNDKIVNYLFHGDWGDLGNTTKDDVVVKWDLNKVKLSDETLTIDASIPKLVNSSILISKNDADLSQVKIGAAALDSNGEIDFKMDRVISAVKTYNKYSSTDNDIKYQKGTVQYYEKAKLPIINLVIGRKYETNDIFESGVTALSGTSGARKMTYNGNEYDLIIPRESEEAKIKYTNGNQTSDISIQKAVKVEDNNGNDIAWFLAPTLYQISYRVCKSAAPEATEDTVSLSYQSSKEGATNLPATDTKAVGSAFTVSKQEPTLQGYTFKLWSTDPNCGSAGSTFEPGAKFTDSLTSSKVLYACWGDSSQGVNKDTGVLTYAGLFTGIIALAGGSYYLIKKKNVFKKI